MALVCVLFLLPRPQSRWSRSSRCRSASSSLHRDALARRQRNIMSLGGIAIAIGAMIDAAIVMIENMHKHLERADAAKRGRRECRALVDVELTAGALAGRAAARRRWARRSSSRCSIITVSFLPVFTLEGQEGRLFKPLAFTKTFAMAAASLLSVTLVPVRWDCSSAAASPRGAEPVNRGLDPRSTGRCIALVLRRRGPVDLAAVGGAHRLTSIPWPGSAASSCRRSTRGRCSTCRPRCPGISRDPARASSSGCRTASSRPSPRSRACGARRGGRTPPPTRRRSRHGRDHDHPQARGRVAAGHDLRRARSPRWTRARADARASPTPGRCRSRAGSTCSRPASGRRSASRSSAPTSRELERIGKQIEGAVRWCPGTRSVYAERRFGLLPRYRHRPRPRRPATGSTSATCRTVIADRGRRR